MKSILLVAVLIIASPLFAQEVPEKYQQIWLEVNEGDQKAVMKKLQKLAKKNPKDPWPYWMLGHSVQYTSKNNLTTGYFLKSLEIDSTFATAHYSYAMSLDQESEEKILLIEKHLGKAIQYTPTDNFYYEARGSFFYEQKRYDEAISDSKYALKLNPENSYLPNRTIVQSLYAKGSKDELKTFLKTFNPLAITAPEDPEYFYLLGKIYEEFEDHTNACLSYIQAIADQQFYAEMFGEEEGFQNPDWYETALKKLEECQ